MTPILEKVFGDSATDPGRQWFGTLSVAPNGRIDIVWNDTRADPGGFDSVLYYSFSEDGGLTWSTSEPLSPPFDRHLGWPQQNKRPRARTTPLAVEVDVSVRRPSGPRAGHQANERQVKRLADWLTANVPSRMVGDMNDPEAVVDCAIHLCGQLLGWDSGPRDHDAERVERKAFETQFEYSIRAARDDLLSNPEDEQEHP